MQLTYMYMYTIAMFQGSLYELHQMVLSFLPCSSQSSCCHPTSNVSGPVLFAYKAFVVHEANYICVFLFILKDKHSFSHIRLIVVHLLFQVVEVCICLMPYCCTALCFTRLLAISFLLRVCLFLPTFSLLPFQTSILGARASKDGLSFTFKFGTRTCLAGMNFVSAFYCTYKHITYQRRRKQFRIGQAMGVVQKGSGHTHIN